MSGAAEHSAQEAPLADEARDRAARRLARLDELTELNMSAARDLARMIHAEAEKAPAEEAGENPRAAALGLALARVSKSARFCMALEERMEGERQMRVHRAQVARGAREQTERQDRRTETRAHVVHCIDALVQVEAAEARETLTESEREPLLAELIERAVELHDAEVEDLPFDELVEKVWGRLNKLPAFLKAEDEESDAPSEAASPPAVAAAEPDPPDPRLQTAAPPTAPPPPPPAPPPRPDLGDLRFRGPIRRRIGGIE